MRDFTRKTLNKLLGRFEFTDSHQPEPEPEPQSAKYNNSASSTEDEPEATEEPLRDPLLDASIQLDCTVHMTTGVKECLWVSLEYADLNSFATDKIGIDCNHDLFAFYTWFTEELNSPIYTMNTCNGGRSVFVRAFITQIKFRLVHKDSPTQTVDLSTYPVRQSTDTTDTE